MKKALRILVVFLLIIATFVAAGCSKSLSQVKGDAPKKQSALEPQPEINDPGDSFEYTVSGLFSDDMVLQRDKVINVWGFSSAANYGKYIYGELLGEKRYAEIDKNGEWKLEFSPKEASTQPTTLAVYNKAGDRHEYNNVLIGDVWIVSGQSNAEFMFKEMTVYYKDYENLVSENDNIRLFRQEYRDIQDHFVIDMEQSDVINPDYHWTKTTLDTVNDFSAAGYCFVKKLAENTDIPQGIVMSCLGGRGINFFMDSATLGSYAIYGGDNSVYKYLLAPLKHLIFQGVLFYQGESDNEYNKAYAMLVSACVEGWRKAWDSDFSFYNIQCTSHAMLTRTFPGLPGLRAAQLEAYYKIPDSYLISTLDAGYRGLIGKNADGEDQEEDYAHTFDKKTIGDRAADIALSKLYKNGDYVYEYVACPIPTSVSWGSKTLTVKFTNVGDGLISYDGGELKGFYVLDDYEQTEPAKAELVGKDTVKITFPEINGDVVGVAYAYEHSALPEEANLYNSNKVPCPTFRFFTDAFQKEIDERINRG